jgi:cell division septum initiation protein DivIVA
MTIEDRLRWVADERDQLEKENYHLRQEIERLRAELAAWKDATIKTSEKLGRATRPADQPKAAPPPKDKFRMGPDGRCINCEQLWSNHYGKGDDCWQTASDQQSAALVSERPALPSARHRAGLPGMRATGSGQALSEGSGLAPPRPRQG